MFCPAIVPVLVFSKGKARTPVTSAGRASWRRIGERFHEWQQNIEEETWFIEQLTTPAISSCRRSAAGSRRLLPVTASVVAA